MWRERSRALLVEHFGSHDHPEVQRFMNSLLVGIVHSAQTVRSGRYAEAEERALRRGVAILQAVEEQLAIQESEPLEALESSVVGATDQRSVFLVHGRDVEAVTAMKDLLRALDIKVVEWSEAVAEAGKLTRSANPYVGDIVETGLHMAHAVVVLFTPDDLVVLRPELLTPEDPDSERSRPASPGPMWSLRPATHGPSHLTG
jgi:hypothetical protein